MVQLYHTKNIYLYLYRFFFNDTATTVIYTLSLHDALPIYFAVNYKADQIAWAVELCRTFYLKAFPKYIDEGDRKSTRLNSSHVKISYAVFCLKKKRMNLIH